MRFNNRSCALMDIPDLPMGAFEHCGDRKIKPQGGGGFNPVSFVTDPISDVLGTSGGGGGLSGVVENVGQAVGSGLAAIDPGPAISDIGTTIDQTITQPIGQGLAEVDKFVNREIPGGYILPAALALAYATGYIDPSLFASEAAAAAGAEAGAGAIATEAGQAAFFNSLAAGASSAEAVSAGLAADLITVSGGATLNTLDLLPGATSSIPTAGGSLTSSTGIGITAPSLTTGLELGTAPLLGSTAGGFGLTGALPEGVVLGTGLNGGEIGVSYLEAVPGSGQLALNSFGNPIVAGSSGFGIEGAATAPKSFSISPSQAVQGLRAASGLLGNRQQPQQQQAFNQSIVPQGAVDYSPILNLLNIQQPQRNRTSLLG